MKVLITVVTYPLPSRSYDELVCTAGILENGQWIRIYPVPLKFLKGLRKDGQLVTFKYNWIELDLVKRKDDFRPESHSPVDYSFSNINILGVLSTNNNWQERKSICLNNIYTNKSKLLEDSKSPTNTSLQHLSHQKYYHLKLKKMKENGRMNGKKFGNKVIYLIVRNHLKFRYPNCRINFLTNLLMIKVLSAI